MGNLKQRLIKPGRDFNYAEGVKVKAGEAIAANKVVRVSSYSGPFLVVMKAQADVSANAAGRLMITKHDIPSGGYGVCLPWKLVTGINTSAGSAGDLVYVSAATAGELALTAPSGGTTVAVCVGHIVVDDTATAALSGAILFASDPGERIV